MGSGQCGASLGTAARVSCVIWRVCCVLALSLYFPDLYLHVKFFGLLRFYFVTIYGTNKAANTANGRPSVPSATIRARAPTPTALELVILWPIHYEHNIHSAITY